MTTSIRLSERMRRDIAIIKLAVQLWLELERPTTTCTIAMALRLLARKLTQPTMSVRVKEAKPCHAHSPLKRSRKS